MLISQIPYALRNTVEQLELPLYIDLTPEACRPPRELALGDTLMVLGLIRNQGRPLKLHMDPGRARELVEAHPLVAELTTGGEPSGRFCLRRLPVPRSGRGVSWVSDSAYNLPVPVAPLDRIKANPILAHSLYYGLESRDDRPSVFVDPALRPPAAGLLSSSRPNLVIYPLNPGRGDNYWQDEQWWLRLIKRLSPDFHVAAVGADDYGELGQAADAALAQSDSASTLGGLAWLISRADAFAGRDGGISHLATAVSGRLLVVWDSMASYRFWSAHWGNHLVMSNPYTFRYPQVSRITLDDLKEQVQAVSMPDGAGGFKEVAIPADGYEEKAAELFGSLDDFVKAVLSMREAVDDRAGVESWMADPQLKEPFYKQSLDFAEQVIRGKAPLGANWVAPVVF